MAGLVSVIMPAYNVGGYIAESIRSVQKQTYGNWELIVVNDGSTDNTREIVSKLSNEDPRIRLITQKNGGVARARNRGLAEAEGEYVAFLDGDDLWEASFLTELLRAKDQAKVGMAYCGYDRLYPQGTRRKYRYGFPSGWILPDVILGTVRLHIGAVVIDKSLLLDNHIQFTEGCPIGEDQELLVKLSVLTEVQSVPRSLMLYRVRPGSAIRSKWRWEKHIHALYSHKRAVDFVVEKLAGTEKLGAVAPLLEQSIAYKTYRFFWRMIKNGYHQDALRLMNESEHARNLAVLEKEKLNFLDRMKYSAVTSKNTKIWNMAKLLL